METTNIELTPEQKHLLVSLSQETGKSITALIEEALEGLREHVYPDSANGELNGNRTRVAQESTGQPEQSDKPIWETFIEASLEIPDEELDRLPTDGATQHDHYIYGMPKRPV